MSEATTPALIEVLLAPDRSIRERLASLRELAPFLYEEPVLVALTGLLAKEESIEVRRAILTTLVDSDQPALRDHSLWLDALQQTAAFESEPDLRRLAVAGLLSIVTARPQIEPLLAELLAHEFDPGLQLFTAEGLARLPRLQDATIPALADFASRSPEFIQALLVTVLALSSTPVAQRGLAGLLRPTALPEIRQSVLLHLSTAPTLAPEIAGAIAVQLAVESEQELWTLALVVLFRCKDLSADTLSQVCETLLTRSEAAHAIIALKTRLHAEPALVDRLRAAFPTLPSSRARYALLKTLAGAELPALTAEALADRHAGVRETAIVLAAETLNRFPAVLVPALACALENEPISLLRQRILDALLKRPSLDAGTQAVLLARFARETDPQLRSRLASIVLETPPSPENQTALLNAYLSLLDDVTLPSSTSSKVIERLQAFAFSDSAELAAALARLLAAARTIEEIDLIFPLLRKSSRDLKPLHPVLQTVFYRFIDYYPQSPLTDLMAMLFGDVTGADPVLQAQIPRVVKLTGASHLLKAADTDTRKKNVYDEINRLMMEGDFSKAQQTLRTSFDDGVLRKSDLLRLYYGTLAHPSFDSLQHALLEIMKKAKLITPEIVDRTLSFLTTYPTADNAYSLASYLGELGPTLPDYVDKARAAISQANLSRYCLMGTSPRESSYCSGTGWGDIAYRGIWHQNWNIPNLLEERIARPQAFRDLLLTPLIPGVPFGHSIHLLALEELRRKNQWDIADFKAVCTFLRNCYPTKTETLPYAEFAALLATERWNDLRNRGSRNEPPPDAETIEMVTELFFYQAKNWIAQGGPALEEIVKPIPGINLDYLARIWGSDPQESAELFLSYIFVLRPDARPADKTIPHVNREFGRDYEKKPTPKPRFATMDRPNEITSFVLLCDIPTTDLGYQSLWQSLLKIAYGSMEILFTQNLQKIPEERRNAIIAFMNAPPPIPPAH